MEARSLSCRRPLAVLALMLCGLLLCRGYFVEPYEVPTGSMAPAIFGRHRAAVCPRCGFHVVVGRDPAENWGRQSRRRWYAQVCCPNCGAGQLHLDQAPEADGDQLLVNKSAFVFRRPRRWEIIVFRLFGKTFIKRLLGLPGEVLEIRAGDLYINDRLARKTLAQCRAMCLLFFDNDCQPQPEGWRLRWEVPATQPGDHPLVGKELHLDGSVSAGGQWVTYRHYLLDEGQTQALRDWCPYNGRESRLPDLVHDFLVECEVEVQAGSGRVCFQLRDGADTVSAELPIGSAAGPLVFRSWPEAEPKAGACGEAPPASRVLYHGPGVRLQPGRTYQVVLAFVDRRLSLQVNGCSPVPPVDLPEAVCRAGVVRPLTLGAWGARVVVRHLRLYRDVHYTQAGQNGVRGRAVHLGPDQYFVLGDNSPCSEDSRFWPDQGVVPAASLIGKPFLVHLPSRVATWELFGRPHRSCLPDWARIHWLR